MDSIIAPELEEHAQSILDEYSFVDESGFAGMEHIAESAAVHPSDRLYAHIILACSQARAIPFGSHEHKPSTTHNAHKTHFIRAFLSHYGGAHHKSAVRSVLKERFMAAISESSRKIDALEKKRDSKLEAAHREYTHSKHKSRSKFLSWIRTTGIGFGGGALIAGLMGAPVVGVTILAIGVAVGYGFYRSEQGSKKASLASLESNCRSIQRDFESECHLAVEREVHDIGASCYSWSSTHAATPSERKKHLSDVFRRLAPTLNELFRFPSSAAMERGGIVVASVKEAQFIEFDNVANHQSLSACDRALSILHTDRQEAEVLFRDIVLPTLFDIAPRVLGVKLTPPAVIPKDAAELEEFILRVRSILSAEKLTHYGRIAIPRVFDISGIDLPIHTHLQPPSNPRAAMRDLGFDIESAKTDGPGVMVCQNGGKLQVYYYNSVGAEFIGEF